MSCGAALARRAINFIGMRNNALRSTFGMHRFDCRIDVNPEQKFLIKIRFMQHVFQDI